MNQEKKIIIIGISATILTLIIVGLIFFLIYNHTTNNNNKINENTNNLNSNYNENNNLTNDNVANENLETIPSNDNTEKKVTVYLFRGQGCHFCENAIEFLESIANKYPYLEIKSFEVWKNTSNKELMTKVSEELDLEISSSVPLIIIGNEYARRGYADGMNEGILSAIKSAYENNNYEDIIQKVIENNSLNVNGEIIK